MALKVILFGTGGWGKTWCKNTLPKAVKEGLVEVVAAVDILPANLDFAKEHLGLKDEQCFTDGKAAFEAAQADACIIASPPHTHEDVVRLATRYGCDLLCEKPISDTVEASYRILTMVRESGRKMGVTMTHRFRQPVWTFREFLETGIFGKLDYLVFNFNWNRRDGVKPRQAQMENTMFIEGAIHQLDMLEKMAGAPCETIYAEAWTPPWGNFTGGAQALMTLRFENSVRASYETAWCNATAPNSWEKELIRAEFDKATVVLNKDKVEYVTEEDMKQGKLEGTPVPLKESAKWGNDYLLEEFVHWVKGGKEMETNLEANFRSMLLVFAAIESSRIGQPVRISQFAQEHGIVIN